MSLHNMSAFYHCARRRYPCTWHVKCAGRSDDAGPPKYARALSLKSKKTWHPCPYQHQPSKVHPTCPMLQFHQNHHKACICRPGLKGLYVGTKFKKNISTHRMIFVSTAAFHRFLRRRYPRILMWHCRSATLFQLSANPFRPWIDALQRHMAEDAASLLCLQML